MRFHRITAAALALTLALSIGTPALAAETTATDIRLKQVTQIVKQTLSVPDSYTDFTGSPSETPLRTVWELNWQGEDESLNVTATEDGKILSLYRRDEGTSVQSGYSFGPSFPNMNWQEAQSIATEFLRKVFTSGEAAVFNDEDETLSLSSERAWFSGKITLNGLPSPLTFSIQVRLKDGQILSFRRSDVSEYAGSLPAASYNISEKDAAAKLKSTIAMRLEYTLKSSEEKASLTYLPEPSDDYYVDAMSEQLVNLTELRETLDKEEYRSGGASASGSSSSYAMAADAEATADTAAESANNKLSEAETTGIDKLTGVLSQSQLDRFVRKWAQLKLTEYELAGADYSIYKETETEPEQIRARLTYTKKLEDGVYRRYITVDAKTGDLLSIYGNRPYTDEADVKPTLTKEDAQRTAEDFLAALWPEQFAKTAVYDPHPVETTEDDVIRAYDFTFAQKANGYFFPDNEIDVRVDAIDGSILGLQKSFDDNVTFDSANGLIDMDKAIAAWAASYSTPLSYIEVPVRLDLLGSEARPLTEAGWNYYNALKTGYQFGSRDEWYTGIDAKTGELVKAYESEENGSILYDDVQNHWAQQALQELAQYGIGWTGGHAEPNKELTQVDCLALLAETDGQLYLSAASAEDAGNKNDLYRYAIQQGWLTSEERDDDKVCTRIELVKLLLNCMGYAQVAKIPGIYQCSFADADTIPEDLIGYAALAEGLGLLTGDEDANLLPNDIVTRAEAATILWRYLNR